MKTFRINRRYFYFENIWKILSLFDKKIFNFFNFLSVRHLFKGISHKFKKLMQIKLVNATNN